jgi:hypothetical protein
LAVVAGAAATRAGVEAELGGDGGAGALEGAGTAATATGAAVALVGGEEPGASVGSLMVGADVGLGGKLMRTVSFLGWTFAASAGFGGSAPPGDVGLFSAISFLLCCKRKVAAHRCQTRNSPSFKGIISS